MAAFPSVFHDMSESVKATNKELGELQKTVATLAATYHAKVQEIDERLNCIAQDEVRNRRSNVVFYGIVENDVETMQTLKKTLYDIIVNIMKLNDFNPNEIIFLRRLGKSEGGKKIRPLLVSMTTVHSRYKILFASQRLAKTSYWVERDYTAENYRKLKILRKIQNRMRHAGITTQRRGTQLIYKDQYFTLEDIVKHEVLAKYVPTD